MTTIELKRLLIHQISEINDEPFLNEIKIILDSKTKKELYVLSDEQLYEINESRKEYKQGLFIDQEDLEKEAEKWLKEE
jgi:hypothetical protein